MLPIIYLFYVKPVTLAFMCDVLAISVIYTYIYTYLILMGQNKGMDWLDPGPEDAVTFFFFLSVLNILYI